MPVTEYEKSVVLLVSAWDRLRWWTQSQNRHERPMNLSTHSIWRKLNNYVDYAITWADRPGDFR